MACFCFFLFVLHTVPLRRLPVAICHTLQAAEAHQEPYKGDSLSGKQSCLEQARSIGMYNKLWKKYAKICLEGVLKECKPTYMIS